MPNAAREPQLAHMVYFTLKDNSPAAIERLLAACEKYLTAHPGTFYAGAGTLCHELAPKSTSATGMSPGTSSSKPKPTTTAIKPPRDTSNLSRKTNPTGNKSACSTRWLAHKTANTTHGWGNRRRQAGGSPTYPRSADSSSTKARSAARSSSTGSTGLPIRALRRATVRLRRTMGSVA